MNLIQNQIKILIIEDNPDYTNIYDKLLKKENYQVRTALSGIEGITLLQDFIPDIVVIDVDLPDMDGFELCRKIKSLPEALHAIIVHISGAIKSPDDIVDGLKTGADGYITRPISNKEFIARINTFAKIAFSDKKLRESERNYQLIIENTDEMAFVIRDKKIVFVNSKVLQLTGYEKEEIHGADFTILFTQDHKPDLFYEFLSEEQASKIRISVFSKKNTEIITETKSIPVHWDGKPSMLLLSSDVTERIQTEKSLVDNQRMLKNLLSNIPGMVYRCKNDPSWTMMFLSDGCMYITGYNSKTFINNKYLAFRDIIHPDDKEYVWESIQYALERKIAFEITYRIYHKDGDRKWVWERGRGVFDTHGTFLFIEGFISDITRLKESEEIKEEALKQVKQKAGETFALLEGTRAVMEDESFEKSAEKIFKYCKELIGAKSGYVALLSEDEAENEVLFLDAGGLPCNVDPDLPMPVRGLRAEAYKKGKAVYDNHFGESEYTKFVPAKHVELKNVLFAPLLIDNKTVGLMGLANKEGGFVPRDAFLAEAFGELAAIALKNSYVKEKLIESETRYKNYIKYSPAAIFILDESGIIIETNPSSESLTGFTEKELVSKHFRDYFFRNETKREKKFFDKLIKTGLAIDEIKISHKNGMDVWVMIDAVRSYKEQYTCFCRDITFKKIAENELKSYKNRLEQLVESRTKELNNKVSELEMTRKQLQESLKQEMELSNFKSQIVATVSHQFRTPLSIILSSSEILQMYLSESEYEEKAGKHFTQITTAINRMSNLLDNVLRINSIEEGQIKPETGFVDIKELAEELKREMELGDNYKHNIQIHIEGEQTGFVSDKKLLIHILSNLLSNAMKYSPDNEKVEFKARIEKEKVVFSVKDYGLGIPEQDHHRLFTRFFRSDNVFNIKGTGLGLTISKEYVDILNGTINFTSKKNEGTTFFVTIPDMADKSGI